MYFYYITLLIMSFCGSLFAADLTIYEDNSMDLLCYQPNTGISIQKAEWSYDMMDYRNMVMPAAGFRNLAFAWGKEVGLCVYNEIEAVKRLCDGKKQCTIRANRQTFSDACHYWMMLKVSFECRPCSQDRKKRAVDFVCDLTAIVPPHRPFTSCPNARFEAKHLCTRCKADVNGAAIFANQVETLRNRGGTVQANIHSIFMAPGGMTYNEIGDYCGFVTKVIKFDCSPGIVEKWNCVYKGPTIAYHNKYNGHYEKALDNRTNIVGYGG